MKKLDAYRIYLISEFATSLSFAMIFTVNLAYQVTVVGLNPLQLVLVGTLLESVAFVFEIPTGIVADVYSRRLSYLIGIFLIGLGFLIEGSIPRFEAILAAQVVWGIGSTFTSGAYEAWLADEIGEAKLGQALLRGNQVGQMGALIGIATSVALGSIRINLPIVTGAALVIALAVFLALFMPEHGFKRAPRDGTRNSFQQMAHTFRRGLLLVRGRPMIVMILIISAIYGAFSEGYDRLWTAHLINDIGLPPLGQFQPIVWFGIINATTMFLSVLATELLRRRVDTNSHIIVARTLFVVNSLLIAGVLVFALAWTFPLALAAVLFLSPIRGINAPLTTTWLNQSLEPSVRATVFSMRSQADAFGQILGGPILGAIATGFGIRVEMVVAALILSPVLFLYLHTMRQGAVQAPGTAVEPTPS